VGSFADIPDVDFFDLRSGRPGGTLGRIGTTVIPIVLAVFASLAAQPAVSASSPSTCKYLSEEQAKALLGGGTTLQYQSPTLCAFVTEPRPTTRELAPGALLEISVTKGTTPLVLDELNPKWTLPTAAAGLPSMTRQFTRFKGAKVAYLIVGNPDRVQMGAGGSPFPSATVFARHNSHSVVVVVQGHVHPLGLAKTVAARVFAHS
jgi:hypothetical protein